MVNLIFDSHLDLAWNALAWKRDLCLPLDELNRREAGLTDQLARTRATTCLPEMRRGGIAVCLATMMARVPYGQPGQILSESLDFPTHAQAHAFARGQAAYYEALEAAGQARRLRSSAELTAHWQMWQQADDPSQLPLGMILAMEGADAIMSPEQVDAWHAIGLRCASLVHYGTSAYAAGTGEEGPLTPAGRALLRQMERVGIVLDVTHLCDTSFFEALEHYGGPVLASHQNCRALVPHQRQFSDQQIQMVIERHGILGVASDAWMLYPGWHRAETLEQMTPREVVTIEAIADHIDHICQLAGNARHTALGSDLDGGYGNEQTPQGLDSIADLRKLERILADRGYSPEDIRGILGENWLRFFQQWLGTDDPAATASTSD